MRLIIVTALSALSVCVSTSAEEVDGVRPVSIETLEQLGELQPGEEVELEVTILFQDGWYIYAPTGINVVQGMIETSFQMGGSDVAQFKPAVFPEATEMGGFDIYHQDNTIVVQPMRVRPSASPGEFLLSGQFTYQACKDSVCLPPETLDVRWSMIVQR